MPKINDGLTNVSRSQLASLALEGVRLEGIAKQARGDEGEVRRLLGADDAGNERLVANLIRRGQEIRK